MSLKEFDIRDIEMGNLLFGNSRGEYQIPRDWQEYFGSFLENVGFDYCGYIRKDELKKYRKEDEGTYLVYKNCNVSAEEIKKLGTFLRYDEPVLWREDDGAEYRVLIYQLNSKMYSIVPDLESKYLEMQEAYDDALSTWEETLSEEQFDKYIDGKIMIPYEIQHIEPNPKDYSKVFNVQEVEERISTNPYFDNGTFIVRPYYWGYSDEILNKPNFVYKDLEIKWYKYPLRDAYCNKNISFEKFKEIVCECEKSITGKK